MEAGQEQPSTPERNVIKKHGKTNSNSINKDRDISSDRQTMRKQSIEATTSRQYATPSPPKKLSDTGMINTGIQKREEQLLIPPRKEKKKQPLRFDPLLDKHIARKLNFNLDEHYNFNLASYSRSFLNGIIPQQSPTLMFESQPTQSTSQQQQTVQNTSVMPSNNRNSSNNLFSNRTANYHQSHIEARNISSNSFSNTHNNIILLNQQSQNNTSAVNNSSNTTSNQQPAPQSILKFR